MSIRLEARLHASHLLDAAQNRLKLQIDASPGCNPEHDLLIEVGMSTQDVDRESSGYHARRRVAEKTLIQGPRTNAIHWMAERIALYQHMPQQEALAMATTQVEMIEKLHNERDPDGLRKLFVSEPLMTEPKDVTVFEATELTTAQEALI